MGRQLRLLRERAGVTVRAAAAKIQRAEVTIWRAETGKAALREVEVAALCALYGVPPRNVDALLSMAREPQAVPAWQAYREDLPPGVDLYASLEASAHRIDTYESDVVPGLLQTAAYARGIVQIHYPDMAEDAAESRVRFRMERQAILHQASPPTLRVALSESAVVRPVGGPLVMAAQLAHLVYVSGLPGVTLRVVPLAAAHVGLVSGAFVSMKFPASPTGVGDQPPTVYGDNFTGGWHVDKIEDVERYARAFAAIWSAALSPEASIHRMAEIARRYGNGQHVAEIELLHG
ncbi:helix-turn-helix domain-containing protein [Streptomyces sp. LE64]|uniref:helix-turn-helix domain-containing protein n=1 Tax=Streptomyces sp. LE64 TaxID=3448653 RepID=UPI0040429811